MDAVGARLEGNYTLDFRRRHLECIGTVSGIGSSIFLKIDLKDLLLTVFGMLQPVSLLIK